MAAPNTPADFKALISDPTSTMCGNFTNTLLKLPVLLYKLVNWLFDSSGNPSKNFINASLRTGSLLFSACLQDEDGSLLLCDGREIDRTTYADLFAAIGTTYGTPSGGSVFKIPDYRARFPVGIGSFTGGGSASLGVVGGEDQHTLAVNEMPSHSHKVGGDTTNKSGPANTVHQLTNYSGAGETFDTNTQGNGDPHNNLPPYLPCYIYIIL